MNRSIIIFAAIFLIISNQASKLTIPSFVRFGEDANLICDIENMSLPITSITWSKDGQEFYKNIIGHLVVVYSTLKGVNVDESLSASPYNITLKSVSFNTSGVYTCNVKLDDTTNDKIEMSGTLKVIGGRFAVVTYLKTE